VGRYETVCHTGTSLDGIEIIPSLSLRAVSYRYARTKFAKLILRKINNTVAPRCHILKLKCTKFDFGWAPPETPLGELKRSPDPLAGFKGATSMEGGGGTIRHDTRCYFNVRSKADMSQLNLPHGTDK